MARIQKNLTQEEMSVVGECLYRCMNIAEKELKEFKTSGVNDTIQEIKLKQKYDQIHNVWRKVMKGWACNLVGLMVQPVFME